MTAFRIKICCMASLAEARMAADAGADLIGLVGPMPTGSGVISAERCAEIAREAPAWVSPVLLTASTDPAVLEEEIRACGVRVVQLVDHVDPALHAELALRLPDVRRLQVIHVEDQGALDLIAAYGEAPDGYLLDSGRPSLAELGGTGRVHDWTISAEFVRRAPRPVFLAGGLDPGNVAEAIRTVRPFGIDVCSGLRTREGLDAGRLAAFIATARGTARDIGRGP